MKIFNEIVAKGSYADNNESLVIKILDNFPEEYSDCGESSRFLLKINSIKLDSSRRVSFKSEKIMKKFKLSINSTAAQKSISDLKRDSDDSLRFSQNIPKLSKLKEN